MKSGLSWFSNRAAHVEHGIRNAIFPSAAAPPALLAALPVPLVAGAPPGAELPLPLLLHPAASANAAAATPTTARMLFIEPPVKGEVTSALLGPVPGPVPALMTVSLRGPGYKGAYDFVRYL
jgi:hypothetical protein